MVKIKNKSFKIALLIVAIVFGLFIGSQYNNLIEPIFESYSEINHNEIENNHGYVNVKNNLDSPLPSLLNELSNTSVPLENRILAANKLAENKNQDAFEIFAEIAQNETEDIILRYKVTRGLGMLENENAVPMLSSLLLSQQEDEHLRIISALALGDIGGSDAMSSLSQALNDNNSDIRFKALQGLGETGDSAAIDYIVLALDDSDKYVKAEAIHALGKLGDPTHTLIIKEQLETTSDGFIVIACLEALGNIGGEESIAILNGYANHSNELFRVNAEKALASVKG